MGAAPYRSTLIPTRLEKKGPRDWNKGRPDHDRPALTGGAFAFSCAVIVTHARAGSPGCDTETALRPARLLPT